MCGLHLLLPQPQMAGVSPLHRHGWGCHHFPKASQLWSWDLTTSRLPPQTQEGPSSPRCLGPPPTV